MGMKKTSIIPGRAPYPQPTRLTPGLHELSSGYEGVCGPAMVTFGSQRKFHP